MRTTLGELRSAISEVYSEPVGRKREMARVGLITIEQVKEALAGIADEGESTEQLVAAERALASISDFFKNVMSRSE